MDRAEIISLLGDLAAELGRRGTSAEMYVVGGLDPAAGFFVEEVFADV